jgi:hypothetical protein
MNQLQKKRAGGAAQSIIVHYNYNNKAPALVQIISSAKNSHAISRNTAMWSVLSHEERRLMHAAAMIVAAAIARCILAASESL